MLSLALKFIVCALLAAAVVFDARARTLPNELAIALAFVSVFFVFAETGTKACAIAVLRALAFCAVLFAFEAASRRKRDVVGIGIGDLKALFSLLTLDFYAGFFGFAAGLLLLAGTCVVKDRDSLPVLPFVIPCFLVLWLVFAL